MLENPTHVEAFLILLLPFYPFCSLWPVLHHSRCTSHMHSEQSDEIKQNNEKLPLCSLTILRARPWLKSRQIATTNFILTLALLSQKEWKLLTFQFPQPPSCLPQCWSASHYLAPLEVRLPPSPLSRATVRHRTVINNSSSFWNPRSRSFRLKNQLSVL